MPDMPRLPRCLLTPGIAIALTLSTMASADRPATGNAGGAPPAQDPQATVDPATMTPGPSAGRPVESAPERPAPREAISQDKAVALVRQRTGGKVVRADRRVEGDKVNYQVRVVTPDGRVRDYRVDAATGQVR